MMKPYRSYKETKYDWIPQIPEHWQRKPIRSMTKVSDLRNGSRSDLELLSVYREYGIIRKSSRDDNHNVESVDLSNYKFVDVGYLVMNKMKMWQGSLGVSAYKGIVSPAYIVCTLTAEMNYKYFHLLLRSSAFKTYYNRISYGVRVGQWDMRYDDFKQLEVFLPPRSEQDQIVRFLDWKLFKINKLIKAKKRQIALLSEQKQAIINCAVTMGGNGWREISLGNLGSLRKGFGGSREDDKADGAACIRYGDIYRVGALSLSHPITRISHQSTGFYSRVYKEEMLFALSGETKDEIGQALVNNIESDTWTSGDTGIFTAKSEVLPRFLSYALRCPYVVKQRASLAKGDIIVHISTGALKQLRILIPPISEQEAVIVNLDQKCNIIEKSIEQKHAQITLLNEYQTSLVSYVVTGKIDVRDVVVPHFEVEDEGLEDEIDDEEIGQVEEAEGE